MRKWLILGVLALVLAATGFAVHNGQIDVRAIREFVAAKTGTPAKAAVPPKAPSKISVEVVEVKLGPISTKVSALGTLQASQSVTIQPEIAGKVTKVGFREGDRVKAGSALIELDRSILLAEMEQAKTGLE